MLACVLPPLEVLWHICALCLLVNACFAIMYKLYTLHYYIYCSQARASTAHACGGLWMHVCGSNAPQALDSTGCEQRCAIRIDTVNHTLQVLQVLFY